MKKAANPLALWCLKMGILAAFFIPLTSFAQSGHFVLLQQGSVASTTLYGVGHPFYEVRIGSGYQGTTTGAFMAVSVTTLTTTSNFVVDIIGYPTSAYSGSVSDCRYDSRNQVAGVYSATSSDPFLQLDFQQVFGTAGSCAFNPALFYKVTVDANFSNPVVTGPGSLAGRYDWSVPVGWATTTATISDFFPYFTIVADGFQITPTASSSGLFLSGAQEFCNSQFGSSTSIGSYVGQGICIGFGYLLVPTAESVQQFTQISSVLAQVVPFSYFYDVSDIFNSSTASSSVNFTPLTLNLRGTGVGSTTAWASVLPSSFSYLSSTTITTYVPGTLYDLLFLLMRSAIWIAVLFHLYHRLVPKHVTHV